MNNQKNATEINPSEFLEGLLVNMPDPNLPEPDLVSYYILEKERKVFLDRDVGPDIMAITRLIMRWNMMDKGIPVENREPIRIYIFSYGGDSDYMWSMIDAITLSKTPVITINMGVAASAASAIFIAGHERLMLPSAEVIIHEGSAEIAGDAVKVIDATNSYKELLKKLKEFYIDHTEIPRAHINKKRNNDWHLDSKYCLEHKVCDRVVESLEEVL